MTATCSKCRQVFQPAMIRDGLCPNCHVAAEDKTTRPPSTANTIAGLASFIIPGLGQLVQGRLGVALFFVVFEFLAVLSILIVIGFITVPIVHIVAAYEAATHQT